MHSLQGTAHCRPKNVSASRNESDRHETFSTILLAASGARGHRAAMRTAQSTPNLRTYATRSNASFEYLGLVPSPPRTALYAQEVPVRPTPTHRHGAHHVRQPEATANLPISLQPRPSTSPMPSATSPTTSSHAGFSPLPASRAQARMHLREVRKQLFASSSKDDARRTSERRRRAAQYVGVGDAPRETAAPYVIAHYWGPIDAYERLYGARSPVVDESPWAFVHRAYDLSAEVDGLDPMQRDERLKRAADDARRRRLRGQRLLGRSPTLHLTSGGAAGGGRAGLAPPPPAKPLLPRIRPPAVEVGQA